MKNPKEIKKRIKILKEKAEYFYMFDDMERLGKINKEIKALEFNMYQLFSDELDMSDSIYNQS